MKEQVREEPKILAAAERQMQAWARAQEMTDRTIASRLADEVPSRLGPYVAISREAGAGGSRIAEMVGQTLGWEVLDKNLLDLVAERFELSRPMLELVDETASNWVYDILGTWLDPNIIPHEKYVAHLGRVVLAAAHHGKVVLVGRGAQFLLPRRGGLAVRIIAPEPYRIDRIRRLHDTTASNARRLMLEIDRGRREFVERYFHRDINDPHLYDLVINVEHTDISAAVEQIVASCPR
jgi:cytidylate kinase